MEWIGLEHIGQVFPVVFASPEMAAQLVGAKIAAFDWVVLDNAHDLPQQLGVQILQLGNQQLVFGRPLEAEAPRLDSNALAWMLEQKGRQHLQFNRVHSKDSAAPARLDSSQTPDTHAFHQLLQQTLAPYIEAKRLEFQVSVEGVLVDLLVQPLAPQMGKGLAVIIDGGLLHQAPYDFQLAVQRQQILKQQGYSLYYLWSVDWWQDDQQAVEQLLAQILAFDQQQVVLDEEE